MWPGVSSPSCLPVLSFLFMCMGVGGAPGGQKILDPLELELQVIVRIPTWMLGLNSIFWKDNTCSELQGLMT